MPEHFSPLSLVAATHQQKGAKKLICGQQMCVFGAYALFLSLACAIFF
jgi:hypothetical protein